MLGLLGQFELFELEQHGLEQHGLEQHGLGKPEEELKPRSAKKYLFFYACKYIM